MNEVINVRDIEQIYRIMACETDRDDMRGLVSLQTQVFASEIVEEVIVMTDADVLTAAIELDRQAETDERVSHEVTTHGDLRSRYEAQLRNSAQGYKDNPEAAIQAARHDLRACLAARLFRVRYAGDRVSLYKNYALLVDDTEVRAGSLLTNRMIWAFLEDTREQSLAEV